MVKPPAAAGTLSLLNTEFTDTLFGFQFLGGLDYALTEKVSIGMKARWASFQDLEGDTVWDLIRSHRPVRADGETPFDSKLTFQRHPILGAQLRSEVLLLTLTLGCACNRNGYAKCGALTPPNIFLGFRREMESTIKRFASSLCILLCMANW